MAKFRKCPDCGEINPPHLLACKACGSDSLVLEPLFDDAISEKADVELVHEEDANNSKANTIMVRICECGVHNPVRQRVCSGCGEDISDVIPIEETADADSQIRDTIHYIISSLDGECAFELNDNLTVIGREGAMKEYLETKKYVSRKHAEILLEAGKLYIKNLNSTNHTFINNERVLDDKYQEIKDGDEIGLGGAVINGNRQNDAAYFLVRIGSCI